MDSLIQQQQTNTKTDLTFSSTPAEINVTVCSAQHTHSNRTVRGHFGGHLAQLTFMLWKSLSARYAGTFFTHLTAQKKHQAIKLAKCLAGTFNMPDYYRLNLLLNI